MGDPYVMPRVRIVNKSNRPEPGAMPGWNTRVYVDDVEISACVNDVQVHANVKDAVTATLTVLVNEVEFDGGLVTVVTQAVRDALLGLGWTPPPGES